MKQIGGKSQPGTYQRIINLIPEHRVYIEPFLGGAAIMRLKAPSAISIGLDLVTPRVTLPAGAQFILGDGIEFLRKYPWKGDEFVYCDPPYILSTRGGRRYYKFEMEDNQHRLLLSVLMRIKAKVMISGYPSAIYDRYLDGWNKEIFTVWTRAHTKATEVLWFNFERPLLPVDQRYFGKDYRDRLRLKRKAARWLSRLMTLPAAERAYLIRSINACSDVGNDAADRSGSWGDRKQRQIQRCGPSQPSPGANAESGVGARAPRGTPQMAMGAATP